MRRTENLSVTKRVLFMEKWRTRYGWINEAYHWRKEGGFASASEAGSCYNADRNEIYYFNRDSLFVYNMETGSTSAKALPNGVL